MKEIINLVNLSKHAGQRFDLVQAGGGNSSVKLNDGTMLIKASGYSLSELEVDKGYCKVDNAQLIAVLNNSDVIGQQSKNQREQLATALTKKALIGEQQSRPSIETLLHSLLDTYVLHTHPIVVNAITCKATWKTILEHLFDDAMYVPYQTPGIELALTLRQELIAYQQKHGAKPHLIFLQNHGLIITAQTHEEVMFLTEQVMLTIERYLDVDMSRYKQTTALASLLNKQSENRYITYLCDDQRILWLLKNKRSLFFASPFCPDTVVYCGFQALELDALNNKTAITHYKAHYQELPKIILYQDNLFFVAPSIRKAKECEEVFKFHLLALELANSTTIAPLPEEELFYLQAWEAEKYRQSL